MINDSDLQYVKVGSYIGYPLTWIIDGQCLYDLPLNKEYADIFTSCTNVIDISDQYPDHNGITVRLMKDEELLTDFQTSEYFGSILLSNPTVVNLLDYPYGSYVFGDNATFDGTKFTIKDMDMKQLLEYVYPKSSSGKEHNI